MRVENHKNMLPIKMWLDEVEPKAMQQAYNLASLPFAHHHIALMPDCHTGYGMPIGGVLATEDVVIPNAVGVDIGCGMHAVSTSLRANECSGWEEVIRTIQQAIPVGRNHHKTMVPENKMPYEGLRTWSPCEDEFNNARYQMGTLGGGNHFIEIQRSNNGFIWVMLHSGSRNVGYKTARHHNQVADFLNKRWKSSVPPSHQLAFLPIDSEAGDAYMTDMSWCLKFARMNRQHMMDQIKEILHEFFPDVRFSKELDVHHNYASIEHHFGKDVVVHRKGATRAGEGEVGIIPGSMGTNSYIVEGFGNPESFRSCSHGAGRVMSRTAAKEQLDLETEKGIMDAKGIVHFLQSRSKLDEAPSAYKDIDEVMANQKDLVKIVCSLEPVAVLKG